MAIRPFFGYGCAPRTIIPPELANEAALLSYLGVSSAELKKIWWHRGRMYHNFNVAKKSGKLRTINAPDRRLKYLQRQLALLLDTLYSPRNSVHGYVIGRSVKTNAISHLKQKFVVNLDIENYFPSITENRVAGMLSALGINGRVATVVARICCYNEHLPQGAPSSPVLSNMICFRLDKALLAIAKDARCIYTRYADDITLSSIQPPAPLFEGPLPPSGSLSPDLLSARLKAAFTSNGFRINADKVHYADRNSRRIVTGLKINEVLNVDRKFIRNTRAVLFAFEKDPVAAQKAYHDEYRGVTSIAAHVKGKIAWIGNIKGQSDPVFRRLAMRFNNSFPTAPIRLQPTIGEMIDRSVWVIENDDAGRYQQGSCFFLEGIGLVTAAHCVVGASEAVVHHPSKPSNKFKVLVANSSKHRDLALLSHSIPTTEYYRLAGRIRPVVVGDQITAIGYPTFGPGDKSNFRKGTISSFSVKSMIRLIEVNFKLTQGMSGGPIIDEASAVVGIIHKGGPGEGRDFAINISELYDWNGKGLPSDP